MRGERFHPRRGRHRPPTVHVSRETPPVEDQVEEVLAAVVADDAPVPPLSRERIAKLEALTAVWAREVRQGGPGPDDTLLCAAPKPPPPARPAAAETPRLVRDWTSRHDPRSRGFDVSDRLTGRAPVQDRLWPGGPVFDQGTTPPLTARDASGCVGMAAAAAANVFGHALTKADALELYGRAQELDHVSGNAYAGTSVLAGMLAGREAGLWDGFLWAFGTRPVAQALLQIGPVVVGVPWFSGMEDPDPAGVIRPTGAPAGGHALCLVGILASRPGGPWFVAQQSRGPGHGDAGRVLIHHKDLSALLAGVGEAAVPIPPGWQP